MITVLAWFVLVVFTIALIGTIASFHLNEFPDAVTLIFFFAILIVEVFIIQFLFLGGLK